MTKFVVDEGEILIYEGRFVFSNDPAACICCEDDSSSSDSSDSSESSSSDSSFSDSSFSDSSLSDSSLDSSDDSSIDSSLDSSDNSSDSLSDSSDDSSLDSSSSDSSDSSNDCPPGYYRLVVESLVDTPIAASIAGTNDAREQITDTGTTATAHWDYNKSGPGNNFDGDLTMSLQGLPEFLSPEEFENPIERTVIFSIDWGVETGFQMYSSIEDDEFILADGLDAEQLPTGSILMAETDSLVGSAFAELDQNPSSFPPFSPTATFTWSYELCDDSSSDSSSSDSSNSSDSLSSDSSSESSIESSSSSEFPCDRRLLITWELLDPLNENLIIQEGPLTTFTHTSTAEHNGINFEFTLDAILVGLPECISNDFSDDLPFIVQATLNSNPDIGGVGMLESSIVAVSANDYSSRESISLIRPAISNTPFTFVIEWSYVDTDSP